MKTNKQVSLLYADLNGDFAADPELQALGRSGHQFWELTEQDMIPLPPGADLMYLPGRLALGMDSTGDVISVLDEDDSPYVPMAAILPAGYTRTLLPAYEVDSDVVLPLFGYAAVGVIDGEVYVAAMRTDEPEKWNPLNYNDDSLEARVAQKLKEFKGNRIVEQLAKCSLEYHCCTAQNVFYERWEAGIPTSPACNANCIGCISLQASECCPSPQERIDFVPSLEEIVDLGVGHLSKAPEAIISFGQGCEGEPLLQWRVIADAIAEIRRQTKDGTINLNTNASDPVAVAELAKAGLDSIRVSVISNVPSTYNAYYRQRGYELDDVRKSLIAAKDAGLYVSINLLVFPGITDLPSEMEALVKLVEETGIDLIQLRNLNIDPDILLELVEIPDEEPIGIPALIGTLRERFPALQLGNFSRPHTQ